MDKVTTVLQCILPIFITVFLGVLARKKQLLTQDEIRGLQQFVMKFGLPCVLFTSCLQADISTETVGTFALVLPFMTLGTLWAFRMGKKKFPYHNLPMLFCSQETGMLGIPLFMILFGSAQAYRMGILDMAQMPTAFPTIAILTASVGENPSKKEIWQKVLRSPLLIMSMIGLILNLSGIAGWLNTLGIGGIITETTGFLSQPVSALMIFCVGYTFSMEKGHRRAIFQVSAIHLAWTVAFGLIVQLILFLIPNVDPLTRWSVLLYSTLPASYLAPSLGRNEKDFALASGVCSILTVFSLAVFCVMAIIVA
ncbi:MAG: AEC family transporter [Oscillospiraceae bacterium]|nr:AEC family transporter [Oscillospiraceae bacterium]